VYQVKAATLLGFALASGAWGKTLEARNDSFDGASPTTICECFIPDDQVAAWLTAPCDGGIISVQILWRSFPASGLTTTEQALTVFDAGTFPDPGAVLTNYVYSVGEPAIIATPQLTEGTLNTLAFLDLGMTKPLNVPVSEGQDFIVALKYLNTTDAGGAPDAVWDNDGCQANRNAVFDSSGGQWLDACGLGVTGDWVIRATVACLPGCPAQTTLSGLLAAVVVLAAAAVVLRLRFASV